MSQSKKIDILNEGSNKPDILVIFVNDYEEIDISDISKKLNEYIPQQDELGLIPDINFILSITSSEIKNKDAVNRFILLYDLLSKYQEIYDCKITFKFKGFIHLIVIYPIFLLDVELIRGRFSKMIISKFDHDEYTLSFDEDFEIFDKAFDFVINSKRSQEIKIKIIQYETFN